VTDTHLVGTGGTLFHGCRPAGQLGAWTLTDTSVGYRLAARVVWRDPFWWGQGPNRVVLAVDDGSWWWGEASVVGEDPCEVRLAGEPEVR